MPSPHDRLVKAVYGEHRHAVAALQDALPPELLRWLDLGRLERVDRSFVDEALSERHADLLFSIGLRDAPPDQGEALVYLLFEHQSTPEPLMAFRVLGYMLRVWERWLSEHPHATRLPFVYPLVLYHGAARWTAPLDLAELIALPEPALKELAGALPRLQHDLLDLSAIPDEELRGTAMLVLTQRLLKHYACGELVARLSSWRDVYRRAAAEDGLRAVELVVRYILEVDARADNEVGLLRLSGEVLGPQAEEKVMTTADRLRAEGRLEGRREGRQEGRQEGLEEGLQEGLQEGLIKGLRYRFGAPTASLLARIQAADVATLRAWMERLFTADSVDDVFAG
ncbi:MAG: Rpn family recombination-promoting nuclease/putative transposase [Alphaproteobacteria bacterium]|nr:Rpn family recombination-promoting nuclease/putative transposase [Alphaproteobacteria bacterium]